MENSENRLWWLRNDLSSPTVGVAEEKHIHPPARNDSRLVEFTMCVTGPSGRSRLGAELTVFGNAGEFAIEAPLPDCYSRPTRRVRATPPSRLSQGPWTRRNCPGSWRRVTCLLRGLAVVARYSDRKIVGQCVPANCCTRARTSSATTAALVPLRLAMASVTARYRTRRPLSPLCHLRGERGGECRRF